VVVLLDDPPEETGSDVSTIRDARALVQDIRAALAGKFRLVEREHFNFLTRSRMGQPDLIAERASLADLYENLALWLDTWAGRISASSTPSTDHTDRLFIETVLATPAALHRSRAHSLRTEDCDAERIAGEYRRLAALLQVDIESFERKRYENLSHAPNKAMNLNSYIGLIGASYREEIRDGKRWLTECPADQATLRVPPVDFLLTIDADSFVTHDYALRLIRKMQQDPQIAVAQTPYSAVPGAPTLIERAAGATTDVQFVIHQGFTRYDATYWVGANALLRVAALHEVRTFAQERGHRVPVFIQDRTVIEDTGSTVDLIREGWKLHNYPERLAYSATPPDFGALIIQRRRWANGGLIILPDLLRYARRKGLMGMLPEFAMRAYYLCSPATGSSVLLVLLLYRFDDSLANIWLPLSAAPYYFLYGRDMRSVGYRWSDLFRVYALNLLLLPVNLAGVLRSIQQLLTGGKAAFGRTPKVQSRTLVPPIYLAFHGSLLLYLLGAAVLDIVQGFYSHAVFAIISSACLTYAVHAFVGWPEGLQDLRHALAERLHRRNRASTLADPIPVPVVADASGARAWARAGEQG
jgi:hypothetical protein